MHDGLRFTLWWLWWPAVMGRSRLRRSVQFEVADAGVPGRAEPPVAVAYATSLSWSGLVKSVLVRAETWMGSEEAPIS